MTDMIASGTTRMMTPVQAEAQRALLIKMRAGFAAAATKNAVETPPWLPPLTINTGPGNAIRANVTVYPTGYVFTNAAGTHQFVCRLGGTTAAAEPATVVTPIVTSAPYNMGDIADGTATLAWLGPVRVTTANPLAPIVSSGAKPAQLSTAVNFSTATAYGASNPNIQFTGGTGAQAGGSNTFLTYALGPQLPPGLGSSQVSADGTVGFGPLSNAATFYTDAPLLALDMSTGAQSSGLSTLHWCYIEVDGVRLMDGQMVAQAALAAGSGFILLDWRSNGGRKPRKIRISTSRSDIGQPSYGRVYTSPQDSIWYPSNPNRYRLAMVGDSLGAGSASSSFMLNWDRASLLGALIGCDDVSNLGIGGTGYIADSSKAQLNYIGRMRDNITLQPDVLYVCNNFNDSGFSSATRVQAISNYLVAARNVLPNSLIILGGTIGGTSPANNALLETDMKTAVNTFNDPNCFFLPECSDTPSWETGTGNINAPNGTGNNDIYKGPTDTIHPSLLAIGYHAQKDANAIRNLVNSINPTAA